MAPRRSRFAKKEEIKNLRQAYFFGSLTILLILMIIFLGIPLLIRAAAFLGELRSSSQLIETGDKTPPPPPQIYSLPQTVNEPEIKIEGQSEEESKVVIYLNGSAVKEVVADKDGAFTAQLTLSGERSEITLQAEDQAGNRSQESPKRIVIWDNEPPQLEITHPQEQISDWNEEQILIQGKTEKTAQALINDRLVILDQEGNFSYRLSLSEGENKVTIVAQDKAGNETEKEIKINYSSF